MDNQQRYIEINGQQIPVTEEVFRAYKHPIWAEHKRNDRQKLCQVSDGKGGLKRCTEDCSKCSRTEEGSVLSLDGLEEAGFCVDDHAQDVAGLLQKSCFLKNYLRLSKN